MRILSIFCLMSALTTTAFAIEKNDDSYTEDKKGIFITQDHPQFTIKLKSNPTTGYSWYLRNYHSRMIQPLKHSYIAGDTHLIGAPGYEMWTFRVKKEGFSVPQQTRIKFVYARPWQADEKATQLIFKISTSGSHSQKSE
ncbi:MAG: protease inhibitor I42 family protein [Gammaproteobacteria bacterium]